MIVAGWILYSGVYWGFAWAHTSEMVRAFSAIYGLFYSLTEGGERALPASMVQPQFRGIPYELYHFSIGISAFQLATYLILWMGKTFRLR